MTAIQMGSERMDRADSIAIGRNEAATGQIVCCDKTSSRVSRRANWYIALNCVPLALFTGGVLLGAAGGLKLQSGWHSRHEINFVGLIELVFAAWFVTGRYESAARRAFILIFAAFAGYSFLQVLRGESTCGCFGDDVAVHPAITTILDAAFAIAATLLRNSTSGRGNANDDKDLFARCPMFLRVAVAGLVITVVVSQMPRGIAFSFSDDSTDWRNRSFPTTAFEWPPGTSFQDGDWIVVLFHPECAKCQAVIADYLNAIPREGVQVALIDLSGAPHRQLRSRPDLVWGRAKTVDSIRVRPPLVLRLRDGIVIDSSHDRRIGIDHGADFHG